MVIILDLDDTLYEELTYVKSGFQAVSKMLEKEYSLPMEECYQKMCTYLPNNRGKIFDEILLYYGCFSPTLVATCLELYRNHTPNLELYKDVVHFFLRFHDWKKYIVTDGNPKVQRTKIQALQLKKYDIYYYLTHIWGVEFEKPHPLAFKQICDKERIQPHQAVYFGDNQTKDFVGITPLGFKTVQILRGNYKNLNLPLEYKALRSINSFDEVTNDFFHTL